MQRCNPRLEPTHQPVSKFAYANFHLSGSRLMLALRRRKEGFAKAKRAAEGPKGRASAQHWKSKYRTSVDIETDLSPSSLPSTCVDSLVRKKAFHRGCCSKLISR